MEVAVYWGCMIPTVEYAYELSLRATFPRLGVELIDLEGVSCCGSPIKSVNRLAADYLALRNIALAEETGTEHLLVPCNGCYLSLSEALHHWRTNRDLQEEMRKFLGREGLTLEGRMKIVHTINFLHDIIGLEALEKAVKKPLTGLRLVSHSGCHILRPSKILDVDDPERPRKLDDLIRALGAEVLEYPESLDCCGAGLLLSHPETAVSLSATKLRAIQGLGVDGLVDSCPACHMMFDARQETGARAIGCKLSLPVVYYTQLLGLAMGLDGRSLGLHLNQSPVEKLLERAQKIFP
ncbi:CoB--CoM heterodisulfide reductase iron-sulfur subunit B family protein [Candidatus Bathyarchaeota archaeon]|nr:CoB--CoM heterodisulfide reductase iron-sulfur subunit B family protein [Candidatus Bathyarchaeota archaeon]